MGNKTFDRVLNEVEINKQYIKVIVLYHGGEPLLNRSFFDYAKRLREISPSFFIKTVSNGMALSSSVIEKLLESSLDLIEFSLDGISPAESQHVREKSSTDRIVKGIQKLIALKIERNLDKPEICISTTQFLRANGAEDPLQEPPVPVWLLENFRDAVKYKTCYAMQWPHMGKSERFTLLRTEGDDKSECDHVISTMTVRADGSIVPCCYDLTSQLKMGNVNTDTLSDIWTSKEYATLRESIASRKFISICANCATVRPPTYLVPKWTAAIKLVE